MSAPGVYRFDTEGRPVAMGSRGDHALPDPKPSAPRGLAAVDPDRPVAVTMTRAEWEQVCRALYAGMVECVIEDEVGIALEQRIVDACGRD